MQVNIEDWSTIKKVLHIEIPEDVVMHELNTAYNELKKRAKIKGFRQGKVPRSVLERMFNKDIHADVKSRLIQDSFAEVIKENNLEIVGKPDIDPPEIEKNGSYKYDAIIEIKPEIGDIECKGLELKKTLYKVSDAEIENQVQMLRKNLAKLEPLAEDREIHEDDTAIIDYEGFKDGQSLTDEKKTENFPLKVGAGMISKDFDEKVIGMKPGDTKEFEVKFPENYFDKKLANLDITFKVELKDIKKEILPEINDEFAKKFGKFESLEELKKEIVTNLQQGYDKRVEQELNEQIFKALIAKKDFEVPDAMVAYELEGIIEEAEKACAAGNISMDQIGQTRETLTEQYRDTAEKQVKRHLILSKIIDQEHLTVSDEELENGFAEISEVYGQSLDIIKGYYQKNPEKVEFFKHTLLEKKAIEYIIKKSTIKEVEPEAIKEAEDKDDNDV